MDRFATQSRRDCRMRRGTRGPRGDAYNPPEGYQPAASHASMDASLMVKG